MMNSPDSIVALYILLGLLCILVAVLIARAKSPPKRKQQQQVKPEETEPVEQSEQPCVEKKPQPVVEETPSEVSEPPQPETPKKEVVVEATVTNGMALLEAGELNRAENCFQAILDEAAANENHAMQCEARYYLAKVNKEMGDLTLACEHWQIARDLYQEAGDAVKIAEIEKDMRENGCPTDWVLNGF